MCYCPTPTLHLNLALTGDGAFLFSLKKTHSVWFISVLNYGDTENVLINHLLLVIPMLYPCHYTNLCPHKPHKHAHTHTHAHTHAHALLCSLDTGISHWKLILRAAYFLPKMVQQSKADIAELFQPNHSSIEQNGEKRHFGKKTV